MDFINNNANIFFFVTTILVVILIIIFTIFLILTIRLYKFVVKVFKQGDIMLEEVKQNSFVKKVAPAILPIVLPIVSFFVKYKKSSK